MAPLAHKPGQPGIVIGMAGCAASLILRRFDVDFLSGVALGVALASFFLGFRALYRRRIS